MLGVGTRCRLLRFVGRSRRPVWLPLGTHSSDGGGRAGSPSRRVPAGVQTPARTRWRSRASDAGRRGRTSPRANGRYRETTHRAAHQKGTNLGPPLDSPPSPRAGPPAPTTADAHRRYRETDTEGDRRRQPVRADRGSCGTALRRHRQPREDSRHRTMPMLRYPFWYPNRVLSESSRNVIRIQVLLRPLETLARECRGLLLCA
jgi:hypothetical protein